MKKLEKQAIGIVAQLFDLAEVPVDKRQEINDVAYDYVTEQLIIADVVKSLPVDRETALKVREDIINEHYKDDPNKSTFGLAFITCYDWLAKLCTK